MVSKPSGELGESECPFCDIVQIELEFLALLVGSAVLLLFLLFFFLCFLVTFGKKCCDGLVFLVSEELGHGLSVEEHDVAVVFCTPAAVASETILVRLPDHGFSAECPSEGHVVVTALCKVGHFFRVDVHEGDVHVVPSSVCLICGEKIVAVRTPFEVYVAI